MENDGTQPAPADTDGRLGGLFSDLVGVPAQIGGLYVIVCLGYLLSALIGRGTSGFLVPSYWTIAFAHVVFTAFAPWRHVRELHYNEARRAFLVMASALGPWIALGLPAAGSLLVRHEHLLFPPLVLSSVAATLIAWWQRRRAGWLTWSFSAAGVAVGVAGLGFRLMASPA